MASLLYEVLCELDIGAKLLAITGDNESNNLVMSRILYDLLKADYDTEILPYGNTQPVMRYQGESSFVRCLAHILNLIVKEFLATLKAGDFEADYQIVEDLKNFLSLDSLQLQSAFSCLHILILYVSATSERKKQWKDLCQIKRMNSKLIQYDVANHWNSSYQMVDDA